MKKINWGIIGLGRIADIFANAFESSSVGSLIGLASTNREKLDKFKNKYKINEKYCFNSYESLLNCNEIDIVYIALPNSLHYEWILKCIESNKKILVEKPATLNFDEIKNIEKQVSNKKIFFAEGFMYRFHPQISKVIEMVKNNEIGKINFVESNFGINILTKLNIFGIKLMKKINEKNRLYNKNLGGGAILDLGCYPVSFSTLIASLQNKFKNVQITSKKKEFLKTGVDIDSYAELVFDNNFKTKIGASFTKKLGSGSKIVGNKGEILINDTWTAQTPYIILKKEGTKKIPIDNVKNIYAYEIDFVSECILQNKSELAFPGLTMKDTICNMKILDEWLK